MCDMLQPVKDQIEEIENEYICTNKVNIDIVYKPAEPAFVNMPLEVLNIHIYPKFKPFS